MTYGRATAFIAAESGEQVFFNFTAIPGEGYRTVRAGAAVRFEAVDGLDRRTVHNVQVVTGP